MKEQLHKKINDEDQVMKWSKDSHAERIAKQGYPFIIILVLIALISGLLWGVAPLLGFSVLSLFTAFFFRNPERKVPQTRGLVVSPADGTVIKVDRCFEDKYLKEECVKISIFMSIFNVHVNRVPISGKIIDIFYNPGQFFTANADKASYLNEQNAVFLETENQKKILFIQIAGLIARRIICWIEKNNTVVTGERFGLICFGSRVDLYLPSDAKIDIQVGRKVRGGETILGYLE